MLLLLVLNMCCETSSPLDVEDTTEEVTVTDDLNLLHLSSQSTKAENIGFTLWSFQNKSPVVFIFTSQSIFFFFLPSHKYVPNLHICKIDVQPLNFKLQTSNIQWLTQQSIHCCGAGDAWLWSVCAVSVVTVTDQFSLCVPSLLSLQMSLHRLLWASLQYQYNIMDLTRPWWWAEAAAQMTLMACAAERHLLRPRPINQSRYSQQAYCRLHQLSSPRVLHAWWQKITAFYFQEKKKTKRKKGKNCSILKGIFFFFIFTQTQQPESRWHRISHRKEGKRWKNKRCEGGKNWRNDRFGKLFREHCVDYSTTKNTDV